MPSGAFFNEGIRITLQTIRGVEASVYTDNTGAFEFTKLTPGKYQVLVEADRQRFEVYTESVEVVRTQPVILTVVLKEKAQPGSPRSATISVTELDSNVPAKARKEFERASNDSKEGKTADAITHLRKAIALYPRYLMAHNDLGAQLLGLGRLEEAEDELQLALDIDPVAFNPTLNLGIVLVKKHEFQRATQVLEKAISLQSQAPAPRLYLGLALADSDWDRAAKEFTAAYELGGSEFTIALFHLGQLHMDRGDRKMAQQYFERYLRETPNPSNVDQVRKLIAMLK